MEGDPLAQGAEAPFRNPRAAADSMGVGGADAALRMAAAMGQEMGREIARGIGEGLRQLSALPGAPQQGALPEGFGPGEIDAIKSVVENACGKLDENSGQVALMAAENAELKAKLTVLEAELIRLRKDRREMEKYLLDKIKAVTT